MLVFGSLLAGCQSSPASNLSFQSYGCLQALERIEQQVSRQQTQDAQNSRIVDLPYLRSNRFLAEIAQQDLTQEQQQAWLSLVTQTGLHDWQIEMTNAGLTESEQAVGLNCALLALGELSLDEQRVNKLREQSQVNDHYSLTKRTFGLYPFTRMPVLAGAHNVADDARARFSTQGSPTSHVYRLYSQQRLSQEQITQLIQQAYERDPLAIPRLSDSELDKLFSHFAPMWAVETKTPADFTGQLRLVNSVPELDHSQPTVYTHHGFTRYDGQSLLQLSFTLWFAARPPEAGGKIYSGEFDGLIWRVTLDQNGLPLFYDSVHPCGCYHKVFPLAVNNSDYLQSIEPVILPIDLKPDQKARIQIRAGDHYVTSISAAEPTEASLAYQLASYDSLRQLAADTGSRSLFDRHGIVPESARSERFILWPMGIRSAGAMRQRGTLAVMFTSRGHFDDAKLFERLFPPHSSQSETELEE